MEEYLGMIKMFAGNYAPQGYLLCEGQTLTVQQYTALYSLIGNTYGGQNGVNFKLPDLRGRMPIGAGNGINLTARPLGQSAGEEGVTLTANNIPPHSHTYNAISGNRETTSPANNFLGNSAGNFYAQQNPGDQLLPMNTGAVSYSGGGQPHNNMPPYSCVNFIICIQGLYPTRPW
ncbi:phage tail protein [Emticicia fontis]